MPERIKAQLELPIPKGEITRAASRRRNGKAEKTTLGMDGFAAAEITQVKREDQYNTPLSIFFSLSSHVLRH